MYNNGGDEIETPLKEQVISNKWSFGSQTRNEKEREPVGD